MIADGSAVPRYLAADLISQAEHSPGASILLTWERGLDRPGLDGARGSAGAAEPGRPGARQPRALRGARAGAGRGRGDLARQPDRARAPARLDGRPEAAAAASDHAGAIFLGHYTPVAAGDYAAGPSHVLPTGGTARWASGLSANDFLKRSSLISLSRDGLQALAPDIRLLADERGSPAIG